MIEIVTRTCVVRFIGHEIQCTKITIKYQIGQPVALLTSKQKLTVLLQMSKTLVRAKLQLLMINCHWGCFQSNCGHTLGMLTSRVSSGNNSVLSILNYLKWCHTNTVWCHSLRFDGFNPIHMLISESYHTTEATVVLALTGQADWVPQYVAWQDKAMDSLYSEPFIGASSWNSIQERTSVVLVSY